MMDLLMAVGILVPFLIGAWSISSALFKWLKSFVSPKAVQSNMPSGKTAKAKARKIYLDGRLLDWDALPKYGGATGWLGLAKYSDVVMPNKCYYPSVCYMDTAFRQYVYDVMAVEKESIKALKETSRLEKLSFLIVIPTAFITFPITSSIFTFFFVIAPLYGATVMQGVRESAERTKNVITPDEWVDIYVNAHEDVELASRAKRMPSYRGPHHISSSGYSKY